MPNRTIPPPLREITNLKLPMPNIYTLDNGIKVYETDMGTQPVLKLEIIFTAGRWHEHKKLVGRVTASLLKEGTKKHTGAEIAEHIDFWGSSINFPVNLDSSNLVLYCLTKHFEKVLPYITEILTEPAFPEHELKDYTKRSQQRLKVDLGKNDVVSYRQITQAMYGTTHPYGYNSLPEFYNELTRTDLVEHFSKHYTAENCIILISGRPDKNTIPLLNQYLGRNLPNGKSILNTAQIAPSPQKKLIIPREDSLQTSIRIGRRIMKRNHADFQNFYVLNTILGGYFGSRLMANLREDKGYTYGAYSVIEPMMHDAYYFTSVEVGKDVTQAALKEIYHEFGRLRKEPVGKEELQMVKNYLLGNFLTYLDGAFNVGEVVKTLVTEQVPFQYFEQLVDAVKNIQPETIQQLANQYLQDEDQYQVIVG